MGNSLAEEIRRMLADATPGPWELGGEWIIRAADRDADGMEVVPVVGLWDGGELRMKADDARLIAAAPELLAWAVAEIERLRGVLVSAIDDLSEHVGDGCAGPSGTARRGACRDCALAEFLTRYLIVAPLGGLVSVDGQTIRSGDSGKGPTP